MAFNWEPFGSTRDDGPEPAPALASEGPAPPTELGRVPRRRLAVLTCMDCRIDPLRALGLRLGDAVVLRNAGAQASDDMLRSLRMAQRSLGVEAVTVVAHTDCVAHGSEDAVAASAASQAAARIRSALAVRADATLLDLASGALSPQAAARPPSG